MKLCLTICASAVACTLLVCLSWVHIEDYRTDAALDRAEQMVKRERPDLFEKPSIEIEPEPTPNDRL